MCSSNKISSYDWYISNKISSYDWYSSNILISIVYYILIMYSYYRIKYNVILHLLICFYNPIVNMVVFL